MSENELYKCRTIRRLPIEQAFDEKTLEKNTVTIDAYNSKGAKADLPGVRWR